MNPDRDERLAAWLDGALAPEDAAAFEREMAADPDLARRAREWRANDALIAGALDPIAEAPLDPALLERLGLGTPLTAAKDNPPWWRRHALPLGGALAASLAAVLLLGLPERNGGADPVSLALDSTPSLATARLADGRSLQPTLTVRAADGRWCREFRIEGQTALACRDARGWRHEASAGRTGPDATDAIAVASGADGRALDAAYRRLGASDPVGAAEEARLIAKGWGDR